MKFFEITSGQKIIPSSGEERKNINIPPELVAVKYVNVMWSFENAVIHQIGISGNAEGRLDGKGTEQRKASGKEAGSNKSLNLHTWTQALEQ